MEEIKSTKPYTYEWAYNCPYCGNTQGWSDYYDEDDYARTHTCDKCKKEFKLERSK